MEDMLYLGKVLYAADRVARLEPLAVKSDGRWVAIEDKLALFPPEGKIFCPRPLRGALKDDVWTFRRRANEKIEPGKDHFLVIDEREAIPVIDLSMLSIEQARQRLFNQGVRLESPYETFYAVVVLTDELFCELKFNLSAHGFWKAEPVFELVPLMSLPREWAGLQTEGKGTLQYLPAESVPRASAVKFVNWCSDQEFVERVLEHIRKHSQDIVETKYGRLTRESVQQIARALSRTGLLPESEDDAELNLERLKADWPILEARFAATERLAELVLASTAAKDALSQAVLDAEKRTEEVVRPAIEERVRREIEAGLTDVIAQRERVMADIESLTQRRTSFERELREIEERCTTGRQEQQSLSDNLRRVTRDLRAAFQNMPLPEQPLAQAVVGRIEQAIGECTDQIPSLVPSNVAPWAVPIELPETSKIDETDLLTRFGIEARAHAVAADDLSLIDVFARGGELLLLLGPQAELALTAYARCVSGGAVTSLYVDPSTIGLEDLWRVPGTQQRTAMAHAWNSAEAERDRLHIICIRNVNAAPFHLWLASLNAVLLAPLRPRNLLFFATVAPFQPEQTALTGASRDAYRQWLVPVDARVHEDGPIAVLGSVVPPFPSASALKFGGCDISEVATSAEWLKRIAGLNTGPDTVARVARITGVAHQSCNEALPSQVFGWAEFLCSSEGSDTLPECLRLGYSALDKLFH